MQFYAGTHTMSIGRRSYRSRNPEAYRPLSKLSLAWSCVEAFAVAEFMPGSAKVANQRG